MESMSRPSLQLALGGLVLCAIGGFWLGLQGALPRGEGASRNADAAPSLEPAPNAYRTPVDAAPFTETVTSSDEPAAESDEPAVEVAAAEPVKKPAVEAVERPAPTPRETAPASATPVVAPAPPPTIVAPPPPAEDLPPY
jgi:hypothetical protein